MPFTFVTSTLTWIILIGGLTFIFRKKISAILLKTKIPKAVLFLLSAVIYIIIEENINCPPTGCSIIPPTLLPFSIMTLIIFAIILLFKINKFWVSLSLFGVWCWVSEFIWGAHKEFLWASASRILLWTIWVILTYG